MLSDHLTGVFMPSKFDCPTFVPPNLWKHEGDLRSRRRSKTAPSHEVTRDAKMRGSGGWNSSGGSRDEPPAPFHANYPRIHLAQRRMAKSEERPRYTSPSLGFFVARKAA